MPLVDGRCLCSVMGAGIGLTACNERLLLPLLHARESECMAELLPSAQPRSLSPALETHAQEVSASPLARPCQKEHALSRVGASVSPLATSASRCHCCMHTSRSACPSACHQLSHASSRQHLKLMRKRSVHHHSRRPCQKSMLCHGWGHRSHRLQRAPPAAIAASTRAGAHARAPAISSATLPLAST